LVPAKNCTWVMIAFDLLWASAQTRMFAGAKKVAPVRGETIATAGGTLLWASRVPAPASESSKPRALLKAVKFEVFIIGVVVAVVFVLLPVGCDRHYSSLRPLFYQGKIRT
jgi:hypothetical protein